MSLKDYVASEKPPNPMTGDRKRKLDKGSINKKLPNLDGKLRKKIGTLLRKRYFERKVVNEKLPDPRGVLGGKSTPYN